MLRLRLVAALFLFSALGCGMLKEMTEKVEPQAPEPIVEPEPTPEPEPITDPWKVVIALDRSADRSFEVPETPLQSSLQGKDIALMRAYDLAPLDIKAADGTVRGTLEITAITDEQQGYIFAEQGRPPTFLAPAGLATVLDQASAYFNTTLERPPMPEGPMGGKGAKAGNMKGQKARGQKRPAGRPRGME